MTGMSIHSYFPYDTPREVQTEVLERIQKNWDRYEVFVIVAPTSTGKTSLAITLAGWTGRGTRIITPNNLLVDQYTDEFPTLPSLRGKGTYSCHGSKTTQYTCANFPFRKSCRDCVYQQAAKTYETAPDTVTNYHMHSMLLKKSTWTYSRSLLIIDEAHNILPFLQDEHALRLWKHKDGFPFERDVGPTSDPERIRAWLARLGARGNETAKTLLRDMASENPRFVLTEEDGEWRGGGLIPWSGERMTRGEPEYLPQLVAKPIDVRNYPETIWPRGVTPKVVLMSATIGRKDIEAMGLDRRKVVYLECRSPIPAERRPVYLDFVTSVTRKNIETASAKIGEYIRNLAARRPGEKGLIHATYEMAQLLRPHLPGDRFLFHTNENKRQVYEQFREDKTGKVLIGSGMYEGLDLPDDYGRWQVVAKIPWPSLGDPAIDKMRENDEDWYNWQTLKQLLQACGRICRHPEDRGDTYLVDSSFMKLYNNAKELMPEWWLEALNWKSK